MKVHFIDANESALLVPRLSAMIAEALFQKMKREDSIKNAAQGEFCQSEQRGEGEGVYDQRMAQAVLDQLHKDKS